MLQSTPEYTDIILLVVFYFLFLYYYRRMESAYILPFLHVVIKYFTTQLSPINYPDHTFLERSHINIDLDLDWKNGVRGAAAKT